jgi:hypothetical protein
MKTVLFSLETPHGTFWIRPEPANRVRLMVDGTPLLSYRSATLAARAVAQKKTGHEAWDRDPQAFAPELQRWKRGEPKRRGTKTEIFTRSAGSGGGGFADWDQGGDPV